MTYEEQVRSIRSSIKRIFETPNMLSYFYGKKSGVPATLGYDDQYVRFLAYKSRSAEVISNVVNSAPDDKISELSVYYNLISSIHEKSERHVPIQMYLISKGITSRHNEYPLSFRAPLDFSKAMTNHRSCYAVSSSDFHGLCGGTCYSISPDPFRQDWPEHALSSLFQLIRIYNGMILNKKGVALFSDVKNSQTFSWSFSDFAEKYIVREGIKNPRTSNMMSIYVMSKQDIYDELIVKLAKLRTNGIMFHDMDFDISSESLIEILLDVNVFGRRIFQKLNGVLSIVAQINPYECL